MLTACCCHHMVRRPLTTAHMLRTAPLRNHTINTATAEHHKSRNGGKWGGGKEVGHSRGSSRRSRLRSREAAIPAAVQLASIMVSGLHTASAAVDHYKPSPSCVHTPFMIMSVMRLHRRVLISSQLSLSHYCPFFSTLLFAGDHSACKLVSGPPCK